MASYKINFASCKGLEEPTKMVSAMEEFGLAEGEEVGILHSSATSTAAFGTLVRRTNMAVQKIDEETREVLTASVERVNLIPFGTFANKSRLEVYAGSASSIEQVGTFLSSGLSLATVTEPIEFDVLTAVEKLMKSTQRFVLRAVRVTDYAANSYMIGPYAPKFMDTEHALKFMEEYAEALATVQVRFAGKAAKANVTLTPNACFSYSCAEDDQPEIQQILRGLIDKQ